MTSTKLAVCVVICLVLVFHSSAGSTEHPEYAGGKWVSAEVVSDFTEDEGGEEGHGGGTGGVPAALTGTVEEPPPQSINPGAVRPSYRPHSHTPAAAPAHSGECAYFKVDGAYVGHHNVRGFAGYDTSLEGCLSDCSLQEECMSVDWAPYESKCWHNTANGYSVGLTTSNNKLDEYYEKVMVGCGSKEHYPGERILSDERINVGDCVYDKILAKHVAGNNSPMYSGYKTKSVAECLADCSLYQECLSVDWAPYESRCWHNTGNSYSVGLSDSVNPLDEYYGKLSVGCGTHQHYPADALHFATNFDGAIKHTINSKDKKASATEKTNNRKPDRLDEVEKSRIRRSVYSGGATSNANAYADDYSAYSYGGATGNMYSTGFGFDQKYNTPYDIGIATAGGVGVGYDGISGSTAFSIGYRTPIGDHSYDTSSSITFDSDAYTSPYMMPYRSKRELPEHLTGHIIQKRMVNRGPSSGAVGIATPDYTTGVGSAQGGLLSVGRGHARNVNTGLGGNANFGLGLGIGVNPDGTSSISAAYGLGIDVLGKDLSIGHALSQATGDGTGSAIGTGATGNSGESYDPLSVPHAVVPSDGLPHDHTVSAGQQLSRPSALSGYSGLLSGIGIGATGNSGESYDPLSVPHAIVPSDGLPHDDPVSAGQQLSRPSALSDYSGLLSGIGAQSRGQKAPGPTSGAVAVGTPEKAVGSGNAQGSLLSIGRGQAHKVDTGNGGGAGVGYGLGVGVNPDGTTSISHAYGVGIDVLGHSISLGHATSQTTGDGKGVAVGTGAAGRPRHRAKRMAAGFGTTTPTYQVTGITGGRAYGGLTYGLNVLDRHFYPLMRSKRRATSDAVGIGNAYESVGVGSATGGLYSLGRGFAQTFDVPGVDGGIGFGLGAGLDYGSGSVSSGLGYSFNVLGQQYAGGHGTAQVFGGGTAQGVGHGYSDTASAYPALPPTYTNYRLKRELAYY